eukprot:3224461-Prymnesium_polylepis.2
MSRGMPHPNLHRPHTRAEGDHLPQPTSPKGGNMHPAGRRTVPARRAAYVAWNAPDLPRPLGPGPVTHIF